VRSERGPDDRSRPPAQRGDRPGSSGVRRRLAEYLTIGTVLRPHGVRGELKVRVETDFPERFALLSHVYLGPKHLPFELQSFRSLPKYGLLKLKGMDDRTAAEALNGMDVQIPVGEAMPLGPGEYYEYEIVGLEVWSVDGERLGVIEEVLLTGSNPVYVTLGPHGEILIPSLPDVVLEVNLESGRMTVRLPLGLLD
jgi:16S rRNA processing protein RimM